MTAQRETTRPDSAGSVPKARVTPAEVGARVADPDSQVLAALAERYPRWNNAIVGSERLRMAVGMVRSTTGATPGEIVEMLSSRELDTAQRPVGVLVSRCSRIIQEAQGQDGQSDGGDPSTQVVVAGSVGQSSVASSGATTSTARDGQQGTPGSGRPLFAPSSRIRDRKPRPSRGWQKAVYRASAGLVNPGPSLVERERMHMIHRIRRPVPGYRNVAVMSMNGGVGKTTVAAMVGHTFARYRGDRVVAVDASPHPGTLAYRIPGHSGVSVRDLLAREEAIQRYADVRNFASQAPSRLEVVASDSDPSISSPFDAKEYERAAGLLARFYTVIITDCGPGMLYPSMGSVLSLTDQLVIVTSPTVDGARAGGQLLDWLEAHGCGELVSSSVVVINATPRRTPVDIDECIHYFSKRVREVRLVPWDEFLAVGAGTSLESVAEETRLAYLDLAACVADDFVGID